MTKKKPSVHGVNLLTRKFSVYIAYGLKKIHHKNAKMTNIKKNNKTFLVQFNQYHYLPES